MTAAVLNETKVTIARSALLEALSKVALVAPRSNHVPVVTCVRIASEGDGLRLTTTDFDRTVSVSLPASGVDGFPTLVVPCHRLLAIVGQIPGGSIQLGANGNGARLTANRSRFDVGGFHVDDFPGADQSLKPASSLSVDAQAFVKALSRCALVCSTAESRPILGGVHVKAAKDQRLAIEGTDGFQMNLEWVDRAKGPALDIDIPAASVAVIAKLFANAESLTVDLDEMRAAFTSESARLVTKLIEGPYPDVAHVLPRDYPHEATVDRAALLGAVKRVSAVSGSDKLVVRLEWSASQVTVSGADDDGANAEDVVPCALDIEAPMRIAFDPRYLTNVLSLRSTETIRIGFKHPDRAITLKDDGSAAIQGILMPRRDLGR